MILSDRLQVIADMIEKGETMADIGTDHGFLPIYLLQNKISDKTLMIDISRGSLEKAIDNFRINRESIPISYSDKDFRISDGLEKIEYGEVDKVVMAGMGSELMIKILLADIKKSRSFKSYIFQPRTKIPFLRFALSQLGLKNEREVLVRENKYIWPVMLYTWENTTANSNKKHGMEFESTGEREENYKDLKEKYLGLSNLEESRYYIPQNITSTDTNTERAFWEQELLKSKKIIRESKKTDSVHNILIDIFEEKLGKI